MPARSRAGTASGRALRPSTGRRCGHDRSRSARSRQGPSRTTLGSTSPRTAGTGPGRLAGRPARTPESTGSWLAVACRLTISLCGPSTARTRSISAGDVSSRCVDHRGHVRHQAEHPGRLQAHERVHAGDTEARRTRRASPVAGRRRPSGTTSPAGAGTVPARWWTERTHSWRATTRCARSPLSRAASRNGTCLDRRRAH